MIVWPWELMSLKEDTLWDSRVFNSVLNDVDGVIVKVVVDNALSDSEVLIWVFNYWFLEESIKTEDL